MRSFQIFKVRYKILFVNKSQFKLKFKGTQDLKPFDISDNEIV
jgi:hypothetical protein